MLNLHCIKVRLCVASLIISVTLASFENASIPGEPIALFMLQCVTEESTLSELTAHPTHCLVSFWDWVARSHCGVGLTGAMTSCVLHKVPFIHSLHAFQSADQVRCSRHSMAALQPALSWDSKVMSLGIARL